MKKTFEVKTAFLYQCFLELPYFVYGCLVGQPRRKRGSGEEGGGTDEQHLSDKPPLIRCGETYLLGSSTLPEVALLNFNSRFYKLSTLNSCFTTSLFTRFLFMVTEILRKVVLFCHHSKT